MAKLLTCPTAISLRHLKLLRNENMGMKDSIYERKQPLSWMARATVQVRETGTVLFSRSSSDKTRKSRRYLQTQQPTSNWQYNAVYNDFFED